MELSPQSFFDLDQFEHATLFDDCQHVWEVLFKIKSYLNNFKPKLINTIIPHGVHIFNEELIAIGQGTIIEPGVFIQGPCIIGQNCQIRHGAYIRGGVITGDNCVIGHDTEIKNTIMLNDSKAAHFAYLGDSVLGNRVNLGAGTKCANLRFDHGLIFIKDGENKMATHLKKMGAIIGDFAQTGCNSVTNPGSLIGKGASIPPCFNFGGVLKAGTHLKSLHTYTSY